MAIPEKIIDEIQGKTDIVEVISRYIPLKKTGRSYKAQCPFHNEKTPSFIVSPDKQIFHCFGCGAGGNVFSFLMRYENLQFPEAVEMLAKKAGVQLPQSSWQSKEADSLANQLYKVNELACQFFQSSLVNSSVAKEYVASRGLGEGTIKEFKIGYAPDAWDGLLNFFKSKGIDAKVLEGSGLVIPNDRGGHYDRFRKRIIFPIIDLRQRILGFGGRVLDSTLPKYINSPETLIYSKGKNLYGLNFSRESIKRQKYALVVEGYLDFIIPYQAGIQSIIATLGTALTLDQVKMLKRFTDTVIMVYDPDEAGEAASLRNLDLFISEDVNVYIAELSSGLDPDCYIRKFGAEEFIKLIKSSKNIFDYKLDKLTKRFKVSTTHGKMNIALEMLPTISKINNAVLKSSLVKKLSEKLGVDEESMRIELKKVKPDYSERRYIMVSPLEAKKEARTAEMIILALALEGGDFISEIYKRLSLEEFKDSSIREVMTRILTLYKEKAEISPARLINQLSSGDESAALVSEAVSILDILTDKNKALEDCISRIKKDNMKDRLDRLQDAIKMAHDQKDDHRLKELITEYNDLVKPGKVY